MIYKFLYLPSKDQTLHDGCILISSEGKHFTYDAVIHHDLPAEQFRAAEPAIVKFEYNEMVVIGRPNAAALKWLTPGMELRGVDCALNASTGEVSIACPTCRYPNPTVWCVAQVPSVCLSSVHVMD